MSRILRIALILRLLCVCTLVAGETREQDRRIEEEKRESLAPTTGGPAVSVAPVAPSAGAMQAPAPLPIADLYFAAVARKRVVFNYDAAKAMVILMQVDEEYISLDAQVAYLRQQRLIPSRAPFDPGAPLRRGMLAFMLQRALGIRGGIALHLFGSSPRYALKELGAQGLMSPGLPGDLISGEEFVQALNQAVEYKLLRAGKARPGA